MKNFNIFYKNYIEQQKRSVFNIETTHRCRLQCPFCQRQRKGGKEKVKNAGELSYESFEKIFNFTDKVSLCGQISDPIYHTDLLKILRIKNKRFANKRLEIRTNGSGKKIDWWKEAYALSDKKTIWVFGLDGASQETANIYRIGTDFKNVFEVMKLGVKSKALIIWQFILFEHNEHEIELVKKLCNDNDIILHLMYSDRWPKEKEHLNIRKSNLQEKSRDFKYSVRYANDRKNS